MYLPSIVVKVQPDRPSWRMNGPQAWRDGWRGGQWRYLRFAGSCAVCGVRTYEFGDGENDPRGVLGRHAASAMTLEDDGADLPACFECQNDYDRYQILVRKVERKIARQSVTA